MIENKIYRIQFFLRLLTSSRQLWLRSPIDWRNVRALWIQSDKDWLTKLPMPDMTDEEWENFMEAMNE